MAPLCAWLALVLALSLSLSTVHGGILYEGTPPPDPFNRTHQLTNPHNLTLADKGDWDISDHPFMYLMEKVRAPNGSWVDNPNASIPPFTIEEWRNHTMERVPWWIRWYVTGETRALRKEMIEKRALIIDYVVSPMDYGRSLRAQSVRQQWHEQLRHFWMGAIGRNAISNVKHNLEHLLFGGLERVVELKLYAKKFAHMNATELALALNYTMDEIKQLRAEAAEEVRWKYTRPYRYKIPLELSSYVLSVSPQAKYITNYYQPYANYTLRYYDAFEALPAPTLPAAIAYPWPWAKRIAQLRAVLVEAMRVETARNSVAYETTASGRNGSLVNETALAPASGPTIHRLLQDTNATNTSPAVVSGSDRSSNETFTNGTLLDEESKMAAIRQLEQLAKEFHFASGIPRMEMMKDRYSVVVFPTLHQFFNISIDENGTLSVVPGEHFTSKPSEPDAGEPSQANVTNMTESLPDYASREGVYAAARYFYSFTTIESGYARAKDYYKPATKPPPPPTDGTVLVQDLTPKEVEVFVDCSVEQPCSVRSGVTVYTPRISSAVMDMFANVSASTAAAADAQRLKRQDWVMNIIQDAFDAERRALNSGLLAPSTAWNSYFDQHTDIFADSVFGFVNGSKAMAAESGLEWKAATIFEKLMDNSSSPLTGGYSHLRDGGHHTKAAMYTSHKIPALVPFTSKQLTYLTAFLMELMGDLENVIELYEQKRDADRMHIAIVNATNEQVYYDGRLYGVLGFGYYLPGTNKLNVAYRDHKIPVPFHLVVRVLTRLQESHLVQLDETMHLAACLAMLHFDARYYRCIEMEEEEKATPRPMQEEPVSRSPPSTTTAGSRTPTTSKVSSPSTTSKTTPSPATTTSRPAPHSAVLDWS